MAEQVAQLAQLEEVIVTPPKNKDTKARGWVFTLNNWTPEEYDKLLAQLSLRNAEYIIGKEVAPNTGTPHLQGALYFKNAVHFSAIKELMPRAHIEKMMGSKKQNMKYCGKSGDFVSTMKIEVNMVEVLHNEAKKEYDGVVWKPWQNEILELLKTKPDSRTINWYWESKGNSGKSFLCKYIDLMEDAIIAQGKTADILNQLLMHVKAGKRPNIVIVDIPREKLDFTLYSTLEMLKNGHVYSGKYEGGKLIFPHPHVIVFANDQPHMERLSADRWRIVEINNE